MKIVLSRKKKSKTSSEPLNKLGFQTYGDYLNSPLWFTIRSMVLYRDRYKCRVCQKPAREVHHLEYDAEVLAGKQIHYLFSLCKRCHRKIHYLKDGRKRSHDLARHNTYSLIFSLPSGKQTASSRSQVITQERNRGWFEQNQLNTLLASL